MDMHYSINFPANLELQLALRTSHLQQCPPIAQDDLAVLVLGNEADFLETICLRIAQAPDLRGELVTWANRRCEAGLEFFQVFRVATAELPKDTVGSRVPAEQAVNDGATEAHLLAGRGVGVQGVVVTVQSGSCQ